MVDNAIVLENEKPGTPESVWMVDGAGSDNIQGFTTADEREPRRHGRLQDRHRLQQTIGSTSTASAITAAMALGSWIRSSTRAIRRSSSPPR